MPWERPKNVPFPNVWHRFTGNIKINGKPLAYKIQDVSEELIEPCLDHLVKYLLIREIYLGHEGLSENELALCEMKLALRKRLREKFSLVAIVEGEGDESKRIAGLNCLFVAQRNDPKDEFKSEIMMKLTNFVMALYEKEDIFDKFGVDQYLIGYGLSVATHYHGDSIALNIFKARTLLCQAFGLKLAVTTFSSPAAIHEAIKDGYEIIQEKSSEEISLMFPRLKNPRLVLTAKVIPPIK